MIVFSGYILPISRLRLFMKCLNSSAHRLHSPNSVSDTKSMDASSDDNKSPYFNRGTMADNYSTGRRFLESFYDVPSDQLAKNLLGHILVRKLECGKLLKGKIVETECYPGGDDRASHSFNGKFTERNAPMYMKPGTSYVYFTYGMYNCFNISSKGPGAAVLIRALEPLEGLDFMLEERLKRRKTTSVPLKPHQIANGPSKLCISLCIDKESCNAKDLCSWYGMWIEEAIKEEGPSDLEWRAGVHPHQIVCSSRIGIESAGKECVSKLYRFYVLGNSSVSKRDKNRESELVPVCEVLSRKRPRLDLEYAS